MNFDELDSIQRDIMQRSETPNLVIGQRKLDGNTIFEQARKQSVSQLGSLPNYSSNKEVNSNVGMGRDLINIGEKTKRDELREKIQFREGEGKAGHNDT